MWKTRFLMTVIFTPYICFFCLYRNLSFLKVNRKINAWKTDKKSSKHYYYVTEICQKQEKMG